MLKLIITGAARRRLGAPNIFARYKTLIKFNKLAGGANSLARLIKIRLCQADRSGSDVTHPHLDPLHSFIQFSEGISDITF